MSTKKVSAPAATAKKIHPAKRFFSHAADYFTEQARKHAPGSIENVNLALLSKDAKAASDSYDGVHKSSWHAPAVGNTRRSKLKPVETDYVDPNPEPVVATDEEADVLQPTDNDDTGDE